MTAPGLLPLVRNRATLASSTRQHQTVGARGGGGVPGDAERR
jgi:hypothetical protein